MSSEQIFCLIFKLWKFLLIYNKFFKLRARKFRFPKYKKLSKSFFFHFSSSEVLFWNIKRFVGFPFPEINKRSISGNIRKVFLWQNIRNFFRDGFFELGLKSALGSYFCKTFQRCFTVFWECLGFWIYKGSEYASTSKYARVLNTPSLNYKKNLFQKIK